VILSLFALLVRGFASVVILYQGRALIDITTKAGALAELGIA